MPNKSQEWRQKKWRWIVWRCEDHKKRRLSVKEGLLSMKIVKLTHHGTERKIQWSVWSLCHTTRFLSELNFWALKKFSEFLITEPDTPKKYSAISVGHFVHSLSFPRAHPCINNSASIAQWQSAGLVCGIPVNQRSWVQSPVEASFCYTTNRRLLKFGRRQIELTRFWQ